MRPIGPRRSSPTARRSRIWSRRWRWAIRPRAELHARIGELRSRLGEYAAAIGALETAAALADPSALPAIEVALGRVHRRRGDLAAAASHLAAALSRPRHRRRRNGSGRSTSGASSPCGPAISRRPHQAAGDALDAGRGGGDRHGAGVAERLVGLGRPGPGRSAGGRGRPRTEPRARRTTTPTPPPRIAASTALALRWPPPAQSTRRSRRPTTAIDACRRIGDRHLEAAVENHLADMLHDAGREEAVDGASQAGGGTLRRHRRGRAGARPRDLGTGRLVGRSGDQADGHTPDGLAGGDTAMDRIGAAVWATGHAGRVIVEAG